MRRLGRVFLRIDVPSDGIILRLQRDTTPVTIPLRRVASSRTASSVSSLTRRRVVAPRVLFSLSRAHAPVRARRPRSRALDERNAARRPRRLARAPTPPRARAHRRVVLDNRRPGGGRRGHRLARRARARRRAIAPPSSSTPPSFFPPSTPSLARASTRPTVGD